MKVNETKAPSEAAPSVGDVASFLSEYASWLLGCGATCIRLEKNMNRMAAAYDCDLAMSILPRHIHLTLFDRRNCESATSVVTTKRTPISFNINTRLSRLSWRVADHKESFDDARRLMERIVSNDPQNRWVMMLLASLANASFCRLFGGDPIAMAIVFAATFAGLWLKGVMMRHKFDARLVWFVCAFVSSVLGATDSLFSLGTTPDVALGTSVLYLVPGIPLLNSFSDMLYRHYICAFSRFTDAMILTCCLSAGLGMGMMLMNASMF